MTTSTWLDESIAFKGEVEIKKMLETNSTKEIRIIMPKDSTMKEHKAPGDIVVQLLQGKIWFEVSGTRHEFSKGDMLALDAKIPHSLGGIEDSILRLTLSKEDSTNRVKGVLKL